MRRRTASHGSAGPARIVPPRRGRYTVRLPRRRDHPGLRRALRLPRPTAPHPRAPRAGGRTRRPGLCPHKRSRRGLPGDLRAGSHEHRYRAGRRADGLHAAGARHRSGRFGTARDRRLPGDQLRGHHAGGDQMELPGQAGRGDSRSHRQGLLHRPDGPSRSGGRGHHEGCAVRHGSVPLPPRGVDPQLHPGPRARRGAHRRSRTADRRIAAPDAARRTGRAAGRSRKRAEGIRGEERHPDGRDAARTVGTAERRSPLRRHAGHARQLRSEHPQ